MTQKSDKKSNRNLYIGVIIIIIVVAIIGAYWYMNNMTPKTVTYTVSLTGAGEVPSTTSTATGQCTFTLSSDGNTLHFVLTVNNLTNITAAHIHLGAAGQTGPVSATILGPR